MGKEMKNRDLVKRVTRLAFGRPNDAIRLLFMEKDEQDALDELDLSMVEDVKRHSNGTVEIKLVSRVELFKLLAELIEPEEDRSTGAEEFFMAMDKAAGSLEDSSDGDKVQ